MDWFRFTNFTLKTNAICFAIVSSLLAEKIKAEISFLNIALKSLCMTKNFKMHSWYFRAIGSMELSKTSYAKSMTSKNLNELHFYQLEAT